MIALETKWFAVTDWAGVHHHHVSQLEGEGGRWRWRGGAGVATCHKSNVGDVWKLGCCCCWCLVEPCL